MAILDYSSGRKELLMVVCPYKGKHENVALFRIGDGRKTEFVAFQHGRKGPAFRLLAFFERVETRRYYLDQRVAGNRMLPVVPGDVR